MACCSAGWAQGLSTELTQVRDLTGIDTALAHTQLHKLREQAVAQGLVGERLEVDEIECRMQIEIGLPEARRVVVAGLAAARDAARAGPLPVAASVALLRLRSCAASVTIGMGKEAEGSAELEAVIAQTASRPELASAHAIALIDRGSHRSEVGQLLAGQTDLLEACRSLEALGRPRDTELCLVYLSTHYRRMGDLDEARTLLHQLLDGARRRGANVDVAVHVYNLARVEFAADHWETALASFREALQVSDVMQDKQGAAYAELGIAETLLGMKRPAEALPHVQRASELFDGSRDQARIVRTAVLRASVLVGLGQAGDAAEVLRQIEPDARALGDDIALAGWLDAQAQAKSALGQWRAAFEALVAWRAIDTRLQAQRLSEQSARLRMRFNRDKDANELQALQRVNAQGQELRRVQALALALFVGLLLVAVAYAWRKFRQARSLNALAMVDELTGLSNRRAVLAQAEQLRREARRTGQPLAVLMIDVDRFKAINDTHGHAVGDDVLRHLARVLSASLRTRDRLGRLGGEEFVVVLPDAHLGAAATIAERMRQSVATSPCRCSSGELAITVSIGVAETSAGLDPIDALLGRADAALYAAKGNGRNRVSTSGAGAAVA